MPDKNQTIGPTIPIHVKISGPEEQTELKRAIKRIVSLELDLMNLHAGLTTVVMLSQSNRDRASSALKDLIQEANLMYKDLLLNDALKLFPEHKDLISEVNGEKMIELTERMMSYEH